VNRDYNLLSSAHLGQMGMLPNRKVVGLLHMTQGKPGLLCALGRNASGSTVWACGLSMGLSYGCKFAGERLSIRYTLHTILPQKDRTTKLPTFATIRWKTDVGHDG